MLNSKDDRLGAFRGLCNIALLYFYCLLTVALIYWVF